MSKRLLALVGASYHINGQALLDSAQFSIAKNERVCLLGRNGVGKSTLFKILLNELALDSGNLEKESGLIVASLQQEIPQALSGKVYDVVAASSEIDSVAANEIISRLGLDGDVEFGSLSGGMKRRVLLAHALAKKPDLLLLDEPTNHLDIENILWLEEYLKRHIKTILLITHDRAFLQNMATRIVELDRGVLRSYDCGYDKFLELRAHELEVEAKHFEEFDKKLAKEEAWIRTGIKARRTRNEGRVRKLKELREQRKQRRDVQGKSTMALSAATKSGKLVLEAKDLSFNYSDKNIVASFSCRLMRGDKVGIIGSNGSGKSTLIKLLLKQLEPISGSVEFGTNLDIAYFDQLRNQLDEDQSIIDNVGGGSESITINGQSKHIIGYLQDFLFSPERSRSLVKNLSGGERNRVLLAKLFAKPMNLLVMDEPTNDLDLETLELLESLLVEYQGTLLLVSHDRAFLNNVVTSTLFMEENGIIGDYVGGYDDWLRQKPVEVTVVDVETKQQKKQTHEQRKQLNKLMQKIEKLETEIEQNQQQMGDVGFYQQPQEEIDRVIQQLQQKQQTLEDLYQQWSHLEG